MKKITVLLIVGLAVSPCYILAQSQDEVELTQLILDRDIPYSEQGALEFWSSGGLVHVVPPTVEFDQINIQSKHIQVLVLVEGQAAVAQYYDEGTMTPKGSAPVPDYITRVTQVYVKENGQWKIRSSHWSPLQGGAGTSQWAQPN